jgi:thiosulfate/3-mercaptopyruvate sulfurtransferase
MSDLIVSPIWLKERLGAPGLKIVDGSWFLPAHKRDAKAEFAAGHIPGAVHFEIDAIADQTTDLPHMLPDETTFAAAAGALGLADSDTIVVYDSVGLFSAPRVWWTLRAFGAGDVRVLDGGLPAWKAAGFPVEVGEAEPMPARFSAKLRPGMVQDMAAVSTVLGSGEATVVDARSAERFRGEAPEPRPGVASGHMPGSLNLPFERLLSPDGRLISDDAIRDAMRGAGVDLDRPVVTSCGSGVTAAVLTLALAKIGKADVALYDGSWAEWGSRPGAAIVTGAE